MEKKSEVKSTAIKYFWIFAIGSVVGCIVETIVAIVQKGHFEIRQGLIYGPFIPVYGIGAVIFHATISNIKDGKQVFVVSMMVRRYCRISMFLFSRNLVWHGVLGL